MRLRNNPDIDASTSSAEKAGSGVLMKMLRNYYLRLAVALGGAAAPALPIADYIHDTRMEKTGFAEMVALRDAILTSEWYQITDNSITLNADIEATKAENRANHDQITEQISMERDSFRMEYELLMQEIEQINLFQIDLRAHFDLLIANPDPEYYEDWRAELLNIVNRAPRPIRDAMINFYNGMIHTLGYTLEFIETGSNYLEFGLKPVLQQFARIQLEIRNLISEMEQRMHDAEMITSNLSQDLRRIEDVLSKVGHVLSTLEYQVQKTRERAQYFITLLLTYMALLVAIKAVLDRVVARKVFLPDNVALSSELAEVGDQLETVMAELAELKAEKDKGAEESIQLEVVPVEAKEPAEA